MKKLDELSAPPLGSPYDFIKRNDGACSLFAFPAMQRVATR
jgi:hypothetical protein